MKKVSTALSLLFIAVLFLAFYSNPSYAQKDLELENGLVGYYSFSGNTNDESGNNNHGEAQKVNKERDVNGEKNGSYRWNGESDQIKLPIDINVGSLPQISLCAWVRPNSYSGEIIVFSNDDRGGDRKIYTAIKDKKRVWACSNGKDGFIGKTPVVNKDWVFVVATYNEKTKWASIYVDGVKTSGRTTMDMGSSSTYLGANPKGNEDFEAIIDEVRIYDRILSKAEIKALRNLKTPPEKVKEEQKAYFYLVKQDNLIVRSQPSIDAPELGKLNTTDTLRFKEEVPSKGGKWNEWLKIKVDGKIAYVQLSYLKHTNLEKESLTEVEALLEKYVDWSKWQFWVGALVLMIIGFWGSFKFAYIDQVLNSMTGNEYEGNLAFFPVFMGLSAVIFAVLMVIWQDGIEYYIGENFSIWPVGYGFAAWAVWSVLAFNALIFLRLLYESVLCGNPIHALLRITLQGILASILFITVFVVSIALIIIVIFIVVGGIFLSAIFYRRVYTDGWGNTYVE